MAFDELYDAKRNEFINGPFSKTNTDALLNIWSAQVASATETASISHDDAISVADWQSAMNELRDQLDFARE